MADTPANAPAAPVAGATPASVAPKATGKKIALRNVSQRKFTLAGEIELLAGKVVHVVEEEAKRLLKLYPGELEDVANAPAAPVPADTTKPADAMSMKELKAALDTLGLKYPTNASKNDLVKMMENYQVAKAAESPAPAAPAAPAPAV